MRLVAGYSCELPTASPFKLTKKSKGHRRKRVEIRGSLLTVWVTASLTLVDPPVPVIEVIIAMRKHILTQELTPQAIIPNLHPGDAHRPPTQNSHRPDPPRTRS